MDDFFRHIKQKFDIIVFRMLIVHYIGDVINVL